jgi:very-short-patch-repair endonuclease
MMKRMAMPKLPKKLSIGEETLALHLRANGIDFVREYEFAKPRKYRADFFIQPSLLIEVEGGIWNDGAHTRGKHFESDADKYNLATIKGYSLLRYSTAMVERGDAIRDIMGLLP